MLIRDSLTDLYGIVTKRPFGENNSLKRVAPDAALFPAVLSTPCYGSILWQ